MIHRRLVIYGGGVNEGGGATLLNDLLLSIPDNQDVLVLIDEQCSSKYSYIKKLKHKTYSNNFFRRLINELWLRNHVTENDVILYFGNMPPIFSLKGIVFTLVQNRYLLSGINFYGLSSKAIIAILIQRIFLRLFRKNSNFFIVQTESMKTIFLRKFGSFVPIFVWPFLAKKNNPVASDKKIITQTAKSFIYPASGVPHKNHLSLIDAWIFLSKKGIFPKLFITIDEKKFPKLVKIIREKVDRFNLDVENIGVVSFEDLQVFYKKSDAMIFPSLFESFGLPLLEAPQFDLPVIASELDYVRDLGCPIKESFDPRSSVSIARAVLRFLGEESADFEILSPYEFYLRIVKQAK